jgi:hypothetical protein
MSADDPLQDTTETWGKECSNLMVLISELYNFQVISCLLVFDIIRGLLENKLTEFSVELLLKVVRSMWFLINITPFPQADKILQRFWSTAPPRRSLCAQRHYPDRSEQGL